MATSTWLSKPSLSSVFPPRKSRATLATARFIGSLLWVVETMRLHKVTSSFRLTR